MIDGIDKPRNENDYGAREETSKPCARRIGKRLWCHLPSDHRDPASKHYTPDCEGLGIQEFPITDYGPKWRPEWSKRK